MKRFIALFSAVIILSLQAQVFAEDGPPSTTLSEPPVVAQPIDMRDVIKELENDPENPILLMEKRMMERKLGEEALTEGTGGFSWRNYPSNLSLELTGGLELSNGADFMGDLDLLTGEQAIDESLQLGSIGRDRGNNPNLQLLDAMKYNLESYLTEYGSYPESLEDFRDVQVSYIRQVWWNGESRNIDELSDTLQYDAETETVTEVIPAVKEERVVITTSFGDIEVVLFSDSVPKASENFLTHAKDGYYDGTIFHRVIDGFMVQGGDPTGTGSGGESIWGGNFEDEFSPDLSNIRGTLAMANAGPGTNGSQFFINQADNTYLDNRHTVFGKVTEGMDVVDAIAKTEKDSVDKPLTDIPMTMVVQEIDAPETVGEVVKVKSYTLSLKKESGEIDVSEIVPVEIKSHPWDEMLTGKELEVPEIASVIPNDMLFIHFSDPSKSLEFEKAMLSFTDSFGDLYGIGEFQKVKPAMMRRLGIPDADVLVLGLEEMAFVSDDLSFVPGTDYALIMKFKNDAVRKGFDFLKNEDVISKELGNYTVIATDKSVLGRIEKAFSGTGAMKDEKDYHYALSTLDSRRDGMIYLSETFIRKLTGPAYRINSRRRNSVLNALETLQYAVFAYRGLTGTWPVSFDTMAREGYIAENVIHEVGKYSIDGEGRVHHSEWGSLYDVTPVNRVPISKITLAEKALYERFSEEYQEYFREFFDPIGIAFVVSDQIAFHTIILPLIDETEYRYLKTAFGNSLSSLRFFFDADRLGAVNFAAGFSIDDFLAAIGEEEYQRNKSWMEDENMWYTPTDEKKKEMEEIEKLSAEQRRERFIHDMENEVSEELFDKQLEPGERVFDFIGSEVYLGMGDKNSFMVNNIADIDVWFGLEITNREKAEEFLNSVYKILYEEMGGSDGYGFFTLSSTEPVKNTYNNVEYSLIPTGFVNVYYVFFDDIFYLTISQLSMNRLIDAHNSGKKAEFSPALKRGFAFVGTEQNIGAAFDLEKIAGYEIQDDMGYPSEWQMQNDFGARKAYLTEAMTLAKMLPGYDGTLSAAQSYYRHIPEAFMEGTFVSEDGGIFFLSGSEKTDIFSIGDTYSSYSYYDSVPAEEKISITTLIDKPASFETVRSELKKWKSAVIGLKFTDDGLDIRLAFGNPLFTGDAGKGNDPRFDFVSPYSSDDLNLENMRNIILFAAASGAIVVILFYVFSRKKPEVKKKKK